MTRIAIVQTSSTNHLATNLEMMRARAEEAARKGAEIVAFPELAYFSGPRAEWLPLLPNFQPLLDTFTAWSRELKIAILPGTLREPVPGMADRFFNTLVFIHPEKGVVATYRKLFLFRATLSDRSYNEAEDCVAGDAVAHYAGASLSVGFSICFDVRFPELFRQLRSRGVKWVFLPSAFTVPTGKAHWETLVRARAIENQFFMIAPAQVGRLGSGNVSYGHSLVVSPWGEILFDLGGEKEALGMADLNSKDIEAAASRVDAWACRRDKLFPLG